MGDPPPRRRGRARGHRAATASGGRERTVGIPGLRGQSTALEYTLSLAVASLVITGLFLAAGEFVTDQRDGVVRTELGVVGEQLAGEVAAADRLVRASDTDSLSLEASLPETVAGASYTIAVDDRATGQWLNLTSQDPDITVTVRLETETDLRPDTVPGGRVTLVYDAGADRLEVRG
ncbi:DUF7266 family protein [Halosimplex halophilum]|uniref:DUF7266 family protein n=1 Tax=Halosimplex halophilum TaxID=2559572 RepID=UPI00107F510D|nr:hypothetical protein [Halosimplex halophilum]